MPEKNNKYPDLFADFEGAKTSGSKSVSKESAPKKESVDVSDSKYPDLFSDYEVSSKSDSKKEKTASKPVTLDGVKDPGKLESFGKGLAQGVRNLGNTRGVIESAAGGKVGEIFGNVLSKIPGGALAKTGADIAQGIYNKNSEQVQQKIAQEQQAIAPYKEAHPFITGAGELIAESVPTIIAGGAAGTALKAAGAGLAKRIGTQAAIGAAEGGALGAGKGGNAENVATNALVGGTVAGIAEAVLPSVFKLGARVIKSAFNKAPTQPLVDAAGKPSAELQAALKDQGLTFDDLTKEAQKNVAKADPNAVAGDVVRKAQFDAQGAPSTAGDITQDYLAKRGEAQGLEAGQDIATPLRQIKTGQAQVFEENLNKMVNELGVPDEAGALVKEVIGENKQLTRAERKKYYDMFREGAEAQNAKDVPIPTQNMNPFNGSLGDVAEKIDMESFKELYPAQMRSLENALVRFGVETNPELVEAYVAGGKKKITPLSLRNYDELNKILNNIASSDATGAIKNITGPLKNALEDEVDLAADTLGDGGVIGKELVDVLKKARGKHKELRETYSPQSIVGKLVDTKSDGVTQVMENSAVFKNLFSKSKDTSTIEKLEKVIPELQKAGAKGKQAIGALQARAINELLNEGLKETSSTIGGKKVFNAAAYNRLLEGFGKKELQLLFKDNPELLKNVYEIGRLAKYSTPSRYEAPKGSGSIILQLIDGLRVGGAFRNSPFLVGFYEKLGNAGKVHLNKKAVSNALKNNPRLKETDDLMRKEFPYIYSAIASPKTTAPVKPSQEEK